MKQTFLTLCAALFTLIMFLQTDASAQRMISYQGIVANNGTPISGPHSLILSIYKTETGGTAVFQETQNVTFTSGLYDVLIGKVNSLAPLSFAISGSNQFWLGVQVDGLAELTPRARLADVPSAFFADTANFARSVDSKGINAVQSINSQSGLLTLTGGGGTTITNVGGTITISSAPASGGTGIQGVQSDGSLSILNPNGPTATINMASVGTAGTYTKVTTDAKGRVTAGAQITATDIGSSPATSGQVLTANGSGGATWVSPPGFSLPYSQTVSSAGPLFALTNSGSSSSSYAIVGAASAAGAAGVVGSTSSATGVGVGGVTSGGGNWLANSGVAGGSPAGIGVSGLTLSGYGVEGSAGSTGVGIYGTTSASSVTARAGLFEITNTSATANTVEVTNSGLGSAIKATTNGTGSAGSFSITNPSSSANALTVTSSSGAGTAIWGELTAATLGTAAGVRGKCDNTDGNGVGVYGEHSGSGSGVSGNSVSGTGVYGASTSGDGMFAYSNTKNGVEAFTNGGASAAGGYFYASIMSAGAVALKCWQVGPGIGATVDIGSASSSANALVTSTIGSGNAFLANYNGSGTSTTTNNNIALFQGGGTTVARIDRTGTIFSVSDSAINTGTGKAGFFQINNPLNSSNALEVTTNGTGSTIAISHSNSNSGLPVVWVQESSSNMDATGIEADMTAASPGSASAAVLGTVSAAGSNGYGVYGWHAGSGRGVFGSSVSGIGVYAGAGTGGNCMNANYTGTMSSSLTQNNIAIFQAGGSNKFRFATDGKAYTSTGGSWASGGADLAETFEVDGPRSQYEPGDVLVLSSEAVYHVAKCSTPYSPAVAGVYATSPGVVLGLDGVNSDPANNAGIPMGVIGVIPTKVSGENGPIAVGDLLVTSSTPGHAMKGSARRVHLGNVLGKAMEPFTGRGTGVIKVLVGKY